MCKYVFGRQSEFTLLKKCSDGSNVNSMLDYIKDDDDDIDKSVDALKFRSFASQNVGTSLENVLEVTGSAFRSIVKDAHLVILSECKTNEDHKMILKLGLSLGVVEWFDDYFSCLSVSKDMLEGFSLEDEVIQSLKVTQSSDFSKKANVMTHRVHSVDDSFIQPTVDSEREDTAASIIKSIRIEEFSLDAKLSITESSMLKKQHARLGRALHCLSQEL
uniref:Uncharacterized protein n=1 Tax=Tanacetum cinerariifolium TaxID=118510 RepID=A0A699KMV6_TANCI|nr:hypothetical protein [Tanacetum cinerariifolium]